MLQLSTALSAFGRLTATAPLLPKLRGYFAEFLNESYLNTLEYSSRPPVSVSGTITVLLARGFSSQRGISTTYLSYSIGTPVMSQYYVHGFSCVHYLRTSQGIQTPCALILLRHPITSTLTVVQEYLTCFPSPTPTGLGLGID